MIKGEEVVRFLARLKYGAWFLNPEQYQRSFLQSFLDQSLISDTQKADLGDPSTHSKVFKSIRKTLAPDCPQIAISKHIPRKQYGIPNMEYV